MYNNKYVIHDSEKEYTFPILDSTLNYMFCKAMNELHEENEQLQQDLKIIEEHRKQETEYTARLEEKNEQLKGELRNLRRLANEIYMEKTE